MSNPYLLHYNGRGAIIDVPRSITWQQWGQLQKAFVKAAGGDPEDRFAWCDSITLWSHCNVEGVSFDEELAGSAGASFRLHKLPDTTEEQIEAAKRKLRRERDVVRMSVLRINELIPFNLTAIIQ